MVTIPRPSGKAISSKEKQREDKAAGIDAEHQLTAEEEAALASHSAIKPLGNNEKDQPNPVPPI